ncbi:MAG: alpha-amylase family glycosyl hydrolase [Acidimicrobiales bacterium]
MAERGAAEAAEPTPSRWWLGAVGYEVYLRSFADSNGDGNGDLDGLAARLDHLAWLGVDVAWITPFYPSPLADMGYDVADYLDVHPLYGDLAAFDRVIARARALGLRVMVDLVPNHTSSAHPWFQAARSSREDPHRSWYHWRDRPNNWPAVFGGSAWSFDPATAQHWLHLFLPEQPDLNWAEPAVADEFDRILRFWLERGVDGFRIDVAHGLIKHPDLPDLPQLRPVTEAMSPREAFDCFEHVYDLDQPGVLDIYRRWNSVARPYGALLLGEVYLRDPARVHRYVEGGDALHTGFNFDLMHIPWSPGELRATLQRLADHAGPGSAVALSSHDRVRAATRFGGGELGRRRALGALALMLALPTMPFLYQGDELGLEDVAVPPEEGDDPVGVRNAVKTDSRDGCRTPMPWSPGPGCGFTAPSVRPWLPIGPRRPEDTVERQRADAGSHLHRVRALLALRKRRPELHQNGAATSWPASPPAVVALRRGPVLTLANAGDEAADTPLPPGRWRIAWASFDRTREAAAAERAVGLAPAEALVLELEPPR